MTDLTYLDGHCQAAPGAKADTYHALCPGSITSPFGVVRVCSCAAHADDEEEQ